MLAEILQCDLVNSLKTTFFLLGSAIVLREAGRAFLDLLLGDDDDDDDCDKDNDGD